MYYIYYNDDGAITAVANITDDSFGEYYIEVDLQTYTDFSNGVKQVLDYIVLENAKIKGKMHLVPNNIDLAEGQAQSRGIVVKQPIEDNAIIINQDLNNGTWIVTSTMDHIVYAMFARGEDYIKEYYIVDPTNRYILLDTLRVNLRTLALQDRVTIEYYDKEICSQTVILLCSGHHVKHIHNIQE
tara:strand:- start:287 stop:841 length:555 start_codon:yes stop_codon:yes gene_type:complete